MKLLKMDQGKCLTDVDAKALLSPSEAVVNVSLLEMIPSYYMMRFWKFGSVVSFNKVREWYLHHA